MDLATQHAIESLNEQIKNLNDALCSHRSDNVTQFAELREILLLLDHHLRLVEDLLKEFQQPNG